MQSLIEEVALDSGIEPTGIKIRKQLRGKLIKEIFRRCPGTSTTIMALYHSITSHYNITEMFVQAEKE